MLLERPERLGKHAFYGPIKAVSEATSLTTPQDSLACVARPGRPRQERQPDDLRDQVVQDSNADVAIRLPGMVGVGKALRRVG